MTLFHTTEVYITQPEQETEQNLVIFLNSREIASYSSPTQRALCHCVTSVTGFDRIGSALFSVAHDFVYLSRRAAGFP